MIKLNEDYGIDGRGHEVSLVEKKVALTGKKKGETYWDTIGYYSNIANALKAWVMIGLQEASDLEDLIFKLNFLEMKIDNLLKTRVNLEA